MTQKIVLIPFGDGEHQLIQMNVDNVVYATYKLYKGEDASKITDKAYNELRRILYAYSSDVIYHNKGTGVKAEATQPQPTEAEKTEKP